MATMTVVHERSLGSREYQAFQLLHLAFAVAPILAGLDKFFDLMVNWDHYLAPWIAHIVGNTHGFMMLVGVVEIIAGVIVAVRPRWGAYLVALWLCGIVINLLSYPGFYDIALRDFGLMLGAIALGRLSENFSPA
ncbi:MAG TPA: hypothetical protein VJR04_06530 [Terriglobales bacterium]|nr:hypothetical protein [Terriglobales bacterium]